MRAQAEFVPALLIGFCVEPEEHAVYFFLLFVGVRISWE
jgi:hypothetical protein